MASSPAEVGNQILCAMSKMLEEKTSNVAYIARLFDVLEQQLQTCWKGRKSKSNQQPMGRKLSKKQELALCRYLD